jgi:hypothetical protein
LNSGVEQFPRELTRQEKFLLFSVLPERKPGYRIYREKIDELLVTGYGRFKNNNFILGKEDTVPDLTYASAPVFAAGTIKIPGDEIDILINEETDDEIEFDLSLKNYDLIHEAIEKQGGWNYSEWDPGDKSPNDNKEIREVAISGSNYVLAFAPSHKKIWLHEHESGVNYLIPLTNYYNELMRFRRTKDPKEALNPKLLFQRLNEYSDYDLLNAFVLYNKYMRRFPKDFSKYLKPPLEFRSKKSFRNIFKKDKN